jgi:formylglycine-generating enzyme required for sulfatase activity
MDAGEYYPFNYACGSSSPNTEDVAQAAWFDTNSGGKAHPVKTRNPSAYGLYDMAGNMYEYTFGWVYANTYRSIKGGAYTQALTALYNNSISYIEPWYASPLNGMRIAVNDD